MVKLSTNTRGTVNVSARDSGSINVNNNNKAEVQADNNGNSQRARSWAVGQGLIDGEDYSAKHYAQEAKEAAERELDMVQGSGNIDVIRAENAIIIKTKNFEYTQVVPSAEWQITHNLGKRPSAVIVDSAGNEFRPAIQHIDDNNCILSMIGATTGTAYLN
ncbi:hypothetical protein IKP85_06705 [bacterium]|nr:hypothetical protein [bacterium]